MLTLVSIEEREKSLFRKKLLSRLVHNPIREEMRECGKYSVRHLTYINRNGRVNFSRLAKKAGDDRFRLLFKDGRYIRNKHIAAFTPTDFRGRLCVNMGLASLESAKELPKNFRVGLYDPLGEVTDAAEKITEYTDNFVVVTKNIPIYEILRRKLMWEAGVSLRLSRKASSLSDCDLIIAPSKLTEKYFGLERAVVLTCESPSFPLLSRVYWKYELKLPKEFSALLPKDFDEELLAGGLYSLCSAYSLGDVVPLLCKNGTDSQTYVSLSRRFVDL